MCEGKGLGQAKQTLEGGGRKITDEGMEERLLEWIHGRWSNDLRVPRELIMVKTKCLDDKTCDKSENVIIASNGWLQKNFLQKWINVEQENHDCSAIV